jgi:hypothetical protein
VQGLFEILGYQHGGLTLLEDAFRLVRASPDQSCDNRHTQARGVFDRGREQGCELRQVGDAGEDVHQHDAQRRTRRDPFQHALQPRRAATHLAGADVAEVQRFSTARGEFIDQHHRQAGAGGDQADFSCRIEFDVIEAFAQLAVGVGIGFGARLDHCRNARLAFDRVQIDHHLGVARHAAERGDEQRVDLRQRQFVLQQQRCQPAADGDDRVALLGRFGSDQIGDRGGNRVDIGGAQPHRCSIGLFDFNAAPGDIDHAHAIACRIDHHREIAFLTLHRLLYQAGIHLVALQSRADQSLDGCIDLRHRHAAQHAAHLAAPTHRHLRLDDPRTGAGQVGDRRRSHQHAGRHGNADFLEQRFAVGFDQQHVNRFPDREYPGKNPCRRRSSCPSGRAGSPRCRRRSCRSGRLGRSATPDIRR